MSHFSVLVVGENVERQLAPYHEFECTGRDDEFVQDVDVTEEARAEFAKATVRKVHMPDFSIVDAYDDRFYRDFTVEERAKAGLVLGTGFGGGLSWHSKDWGDGLGYRAKVHEIPADCNVFDEPETDFVAWIERWYGIKPLPAGVTPETALKSGDQFKYGYVVLDESGEVEKVVDRTNPNKHWDWYEVGGRWDRFFKISAERGSTKRVSYALKGEIDFDGMREDAATAAGERWDAVAAVTHGNQWTPWSDFYARVEAKEIDVKQARQEYWGQSCVQDLRDAGHHDVDQFLVTREGFTAAARARAIAPHAIVKDGEWFERGAMGWWGIVTDESDEGEWNARVSALLDDLSPDTLLTIVDCHI